MASFFKKIYDYLLRLFWYVYLHTAAIFVVIEIGRAHV